jgi:hypothetical protein
MEATCSSETSADFRRTTRRYIPEDRTCYNHGYENLKSYKGGEEEEEEKKKKKRRRIREGGRRNHNRVYCMREVYL